MIDDGRIETFARDINLISQGQPLAAGPQQKPLGGAPRAAAEGEAVRRSRGERFVIIHSAPGLCIVRELALLQELSTLCG